MKVTAFHMVNKVEEAARSYFSNSLLFGSRKVEAERVADFRKGRAAIQFFLNDGEDEERICMGGMEFEAIQEKENKVAFQCRYSIQPSGHSRQFFLMVPAHREPYSHYVKLVDLLRARWEKDVHAYLPKDNEGNAIMPSSGDSGEDDEYEGLSADEIEAITGVRPSSKSDSREPPSSPSQNLDEDDIARLMGELGATETQPQQEEAASLSMDEIEALAREVAAESAATEENSVASEEAAPETELSAEDIWKQITGGSVFPGDPAN